MKSKISVVCVRFGDLYGREYVEKLRNMIARNLTVPYEFVCITDDPNLMPGVKSIVQPNGNYAKGWWHKVHMFDPTLPLNQTILYFDLDVVIHNNINHLLDVDMCFLTGIRDFNRKFNTNWNQLNSSVMCWTHQQFGELWTDFLKNPALAQRFPGDQDWLWHKIRTKIKFWPDDFLQSYKWEIRSRKELTGKSVDRRFKTVDHHVELDPTCCVTVFHGYPKPSDVQDRFVVNNWR